MFIEYLLCARHSLAAGGLAVNRNNRNSCLISLYFSGARICQPVCVGLKTRTKILLAVKELTV